MSKLGLRLLLSSKIKISKNLKKKKEIVIYLHNGVYSAIRNNAVWFEGK
jgi:hypothetical protein